MRRAHVGLVGLRPLARRTAGLGHVRGEGGAEGGSGADEDERAEARRALLRPRVLALRVGQVVEYLVRGGPRRLGEGHRVVARLRRDHGGEGGEAESREKKGHPGLHTCETLCEMSSGMSFVCVVEQVWSEVRVAEGVWQRGVAEGGWQMGWRRRGDGVGWRPR